MASEEGVSQTGGKKKGGGGIVGVLLATIIAGGAGVGAAFLKMERPAAGDAKHGPAEGGEKGKHGASAPKSIVELPPVVTNLTSPRDVWVRIELSLLFEKPTEKADQIAAQFGTDVLAYLRTLSADQIEGPAGLLGLREELNDRAALRSNGSVSQVAIRALVVQ